MPFQVHVEFYGSVRSRAGVAETVIGVESEEVSIGDVLREIAQRFPRLAEFCCGTDGSLKSGFILNIDGQAFTTDVMRQVSSRQSLLILSADVGG